MVSSNFTYRHAPDMDTFGTYGHDVDGDLEEIADAVDRAFGRLMKFDGTISTSKKT